MNPYPSYKKRPNLVLRDRRKGRLWTQAQLAETLGVTDLTVGRWERGEVFPSAYYIERLCKLFEASPEELGLFQREQPVEIVPAPLSTSRESLPLTKEPVPIEERKESVPAQFNPVPLSNFRWHRYVALIAGAVLLILLFSYVSYLRTDFPQAPVFTQTPTTASVSPALSQRLLYQADWSSNFAGWTASSTWHWLAEDGGTITTTSATNSMMTAPYVPSVRAYAIEVAMQKDSYAGAGGRAYGIVIGRTPTTGYISGVGVHILPEHFFLATLGPKTSPTGGEIFINADLVRAPVNMDLGWHLYRVEVNGSRIHDFFDGTLVAEEDDAHPVIGNVGIYVTAALVHIRDFTIFAL